MGRPRGSREGELGSSPSVQLDVPQTGTSSPLLWAWVSQPGKGISPRPASLTGLTMDVVQGCGMKEALRRRQIPGRGGPEGPHPHLSL